MRHVHVSGEYARPGRVLTFPTRNEPQAQMESARVFHSALRNMIVNVAGFESDGRTPNVFAVFYTHTHTPFKHFAVFSVGLGFRLAHENRTITGILLEK